MKLKEVKSNLKFKLLELGVSSKIAEREAQSVADFWKGLYTVTFPDDYIEWKANQIKEKLGKDNANTK